MYEIDFRHAELTAKYKNGANWFYWIAGLTLVTSLISFGGGGWRFLISLGTTQIIDAVAEGLSVELGGTAKVVALFLDLLVIGTFVVFGVLANKKLLWAYVIGLAVFLLDALVTLIIQDWIGVIAHIVVIVLMVPGYLAGRQLVDLEARMAAHEAEIAAQPQPETV